MTRLPRAFYAKPAMVRRWNYGRHWPGVYYVRRDGRAFCILPTGRRVTSLYGEAAP